MLGLFLFYLDQHHAVKGLRVQGCSSSDLLKFFNNSDKKFILRTHSYICHMHR
jgi:hypothetical protein